MELECTSCSNEPTGKINVDRFIRKLDGLIAKNDLKGAVETAEFWENEAKNCGDKCGLLSVINEELGLFRTTEDSERALKAAAICEELLSEREPDFSYATVCVNLATTYKAFGKVEKGLPFYDKAETIYKEYGKTDTYEYAAFLNNKASALMELTRYDEAETLLTTAVEILKKEGNHDADIAISLITLAHLNFDRDENSFETVENLLDLSWEYVNSERNVRDYRYAVAIKKCAPSYRYFQRPMEAEALDETAAEIFSERA